MATPGVKNEMAQKRTPTVLDTEFCRSFSALMGQRGANVSATARAVGLDRGLIYRILDGQAPTLGQAVALAAAVDLDLADITGTVPSPLETALLEAVRSADPRAVVAALEQLGIALPRPNPSAPALPVTVDGLRRVEAAARGLADTIADVVPDPESVIAKSTGTVRE